MITAHQTKLREGNVFSHICWSFAPLRVHVTINHDVLDLIIQGLTLYRVLLTRHIHTCSTWTSLYGNPPLHMFKLVHYKVRTVDKRVIGILLECFRVHSIFVLNHLELHTETLYFYNSIWRFLHYSDNGDSYQMETAREVATKSLLLEQTSISFEVRV